MEIMAIEGEHCPFCQKVMKNGYVSMGYPFMDRCFHVEESCLEDDLIEHLRYLKHKRSLNAIRDIRKYDKRR